MIRKQDRVKALFMGWLGTISGAIWAIFRILQMPSDQKNAFAWGLSFPRLFLLLGMVIVIIVSGSILILLWTNRRWGDVLWKKLFGRHVRVSFGLSVAGIIIGSGGTFLPPYRLGEFADYFLRLQPVFNWVFVSSTVFFVMVLIEQNGLHWHDFLNALVDCRRTFFLAGIILLFFSFVQIGFHQSRLGTFSQEDFWYGAGIPVLPQQLLLALTVVALLCFYAKDKLFQKYEIPIFFIIWLVTAVLWGKVPLQSSYFMPEPYFPNNQFYPYSDSALFDVGSQFALIGQGILNGTFFDRALYMVLLVYLHMIAGQNYPLLLTVQVAIYAIFPAVLYLLGKHLLDHRLGILLAILTIGRGANAILLSSLVDTSGPKMMLTDFPTAICVAALVVFFIKWLKKPAVGLHNAIWAGGMLGLAILLRTNALLLLPLLAIYGFLALPRHRKYGLMGGLLLILSMWLTILPWDIRNYQRGAPLFAVYFTRIQSVFFHRYISPFILPSEAPPTSIILPSTDSTTVSLSRPGKLALPFSLPTSALVLATINESPLRSILSHFVHNWITSILILPTSPFFDELRYLVKEGAPFWRPTWDGTMPGGAAFFVIINLAFLALGIGTAWQQKKWIGLFPLFVFFVYQLSNALARTSGGRYLVPVDWIILVYFGMGIFQVFEVARTLFGQKAETSFVPFSSEPVKSNMPIRQMIWSFSALLLIGSLLPLSEHIYRPQYPVATRFQNLAILRENGLIEDAGLEPLAIKNFLQSPKAVVLRGRALYPRFYHQGRGEPGSGYPYIPFDYPRLAFTLIGPKGLSGIILPLPNSPRYFPHNSDVIVLGCQTETIQIMSRVNALAVFILDEHNAYYLRSPAAPLQCPVAAPVCDNNHQCK